MTRRATSILLALLVLSGFGCAERRIFVTSEPAGATVIINDVNVGQTPVEVDFLYFGVYDVRLSKDGYESVLTSERIKAPLHEWPGFDVVAAVIPGKEKKHVAWHYELTPAETDPDALMARAATLRDRLSGGRPTNEVGAPATAGEATEPIVVDELSDVETSTEELAPVVPKEEGEGGQDTDG